MKKRNILMATLFMCLMSVVFFSTKVEAAPIWIYHPKRTVNFTIKYVDDKTGKEIAPRVTTEIKYQRDLKAW